MTVLHMTMSIRRDCDCSGCCEDDVVIAWWGVDAVDARLHTTYTAGTDGRDGAVVGQNRVSFFFFFLNNNKKWQRQASGWRC
jgi:hypothetical protein